jgi:hypothetical protein
VTLDKAKAEWDEINYSANAIDGYPFINKMRRLRVLDDIIYLLTQGHTVDNSPTDGYLIDNKYVVGFTARKWRNSSKYKWYPYKSVKDLHERYSGDTR